MSASPIDNDFEQAIDFAARPIYGARHLNARRGNKQAPVDIYYQHEAHDGIFKPITTHKSGANVQKGYEYSKLF